LQRASQKRVFRFNVKFNM